MADQTHTNLKKAERQMVKLRNKLKRADLDYTIQASTSSVDPTVIRYAAQMTSPAEGLAPITFIADTPEELTEKIKNATKKIDYDAVEKAYHEAQIQACDRTIKTHEERIAELDNKNKEGDADGTKEGSEPNKNEEGSEGKAKRDGTEEAQA